MKRALVAREETNVNGGAHTTNYDVALRALNEGRDLVVHAEHYNGQQYDKWSYRVTDLRIREDGSIVGRKVGYDDMFEPDWVATKDLCDFAKTGTM